jgi:hypothetical protein
MSLQIQGDIRRSKRKLSIFLDLPDSSAFSQNSLISTPAEKKKRVSSFSQSQSTRDIQKIPIYSRTPLGPKDINIQLSQSIIDSMRKPNKGVPWKCVKKWQNFQPNDHTSKSFIIYLFIYLLY